MGDISLMGMAVLIVLGGLLLVSILMLMISMEAEMHRNRPQRTVEWKVMESIPSAKLSRADYLRLSRVKRKTRLGSAELFMF